MLSNSGLETRALHDSTNLIRTLYQISAGHHLGFERQVLKMLTLGCNIFDMEVGIVAHIEDDRYTVLHLNCTDGIDLKIGDVFNLGDTYCAKTIKNSNPVTIEHAEKSGLRNHPAHEVFQLKSYIGAPLIVKGRVFGTLNFSSRSSKKTPFTDQETDAIQLMAMWIGSEFDRIEDQRLLQSAYEELQAVEAKFRLAIEASPSAMIMTDSDGRIVYINELAEQMFGYEESELLSKSIEILVPENLRATHTKERLRYKQTPSARPMTSRNNLIARRKNGEIFPVEIGLNPINTPDGSLVLCAVQDITKRKHYEKTILTQAEKLKIANQQLAELATKDSLTNVANRRSMMSHFEIMLARASRNEQPISVIMADIDNFKTYNDAYGHPAGDDVLRTVCDAIIRVARRSDIVARYGGEEFVILLPDTDSRGAGQIAERCRETIECQSEINQPITASFGVSTIVIANPPNTTLTNIAKRLIAEADRALYLSKEGGKNKVTHYTELEEKR